MYNMIGDPDDIRIIELARLFAIKHDKDVEAVSACASADNRTSHHVWGRELSATSATKSYIVTSEDQDELEQKFDLYMDDDEYHIDIASIISTIKDAMGHP
jgi:hypothetical protein